MCEAKGARDQAVGLREIDAWAVAARQGSERAAERLYDAARTKLVRIALAFGVPPDDVPDLVQEVLLSAWRNLDRFDPARGSFVGWLVPGLRGRKQNRLRSTARYRRLLSGLKSLLPPSASAVPDRRRAIDARLTLEKLTAVLTRRQREMVALYEIEGLSSKEVAALLGISEAGVRSIARDARHRLQEEARRLGKIGMGSQADG